MFASSSSSKLLVVLLMIILSHLITTTLCQQALFTQAINAAMQNVVQQSSFQNKIFDILLFNVPKCASNTAYPSTNPFKGMTKLKNCYQMESMEPWTSAYRLVAEELTKEINSHYGMSLENSIVLINTTDGFFSSLSSAVNDGRCDVVVADTTTTTERSTQVSFQTCPYGSTSFGFIRNSRDNDTIGSTNVNSLNKNGTIVGAYYGTIFEEWIKQNLPLATYSPLGYDEQFDAVFGNKVHAIIGDVVDFSIYLNNHPCSSCKVIAFGFPSSFSTFTKFSQVSSATISEITKVSALLYMIVLFFLIL